MDSDRIDFHINKIEMVKRQMATIKKIVEEHGEGVAFEKLMSQVPSWEQYVRDANQVLHNAEAAIASGPPPPDELDDVLKKLRLRKTAKKYGL